MKILLVNPSTGYYTRALFNPLGLLAIGSYLKSLGHEVRLLDRCVEQVRFSSLLDSFQPDLVGVSVMSSRGLKDAIRISTAAKKRGYFVVWGGAMPSMQHELVLEEAFVDAVVIGEGEYTFRELLEVLRGERTFDSVLGLAYKDNGTIVRTPDRPFIDLATLPPTDYSLIQVEKYLQPYLGCERLMYIYSSKGCPCRCAFCSNPCFHKSTHRKRPNEVVIREIQYLIDHYNMDGVYFSDELWAANRREMLDFCARVKENDLHFHWIIQTRVGLFTKEDFQIMYDAGCRGAFFGVESGSKEMLHRIHKAIAYDRILPSFEEIQNIGITTIASFIIGYPDETVEQLRETVQMVQALCANLTPVYHFTPLPGTELYNEVVADGRYRIPKTLKELSRVIATESVGQNLSAVPSVDLRVIRSRLHWQSFANKNAIEDQKPFEFAKDTILSGLRAISQKGPVFFLIDGFKAFYEFSYVFWFAHCYPGIRKKYGLK